MRWFSLVRAVAWAAAAAGGFVLVWWFLPRSPAGSTGPPAAVLPLLSEPGTAAPSGPIVFVGDSLTAGADWQTAFPGYSILNQGVSGDTTLHLMARLPAIRQSGASTYLLMVGINDIYWGYSPSGIATRIQWIRTGLQLGSGARVIVQSTIPCERSSCGEQRLRKVHELNRLLRQRIPGQDFLDLNTVMADRDGLKRSYTTDGVHLNGAGYVRWQQRLRSQLFSPTP